MSHLSHGEVAPIRRAQRQGRWQPHDPVMAPASLVRSICNYLFPRYAATNLAEPLAYSDRGRSGNTGLLCHQARSEGFRQEEYAPFVCGRGTAFLCSSSLRQRMHNHWSGDRCGWPGE
jgi:hypothetical protein